MSPPFRDVRSAALALLNSGAALNWKTGQFLGGLCFMDGELSERQAKWLSDLLRKADLPPLVGING